MLNSTGHEHIPYCVCDPSLPDCPIVFSSDGFCEYTGYTHQEIEGKNCRFLQGPETKRDDVDKIRHAIQERIPTTVNLLNYRKDGTTFINEFFISPLFDTHHNLVYVSREATG
jgi:PAS domain S-box-containing protein